MMTKNRLWVAAFTGVCAFFTYLFIPLMLLAHVRQQYAGMTDPNRAQMIKDLQSAAGQLGTQSALIPMIAFGLSFVFAIQGFAWMYKTNSVDFYESRPVKKWRRYTDICANSIGLYALITLIGTLVGMVIVAAFGAGSAAVYGSIASEYVRALALFVGGYGIFVLGSVLSGNVVIAFLMCAFMAGAPAAIEMLRYFCRSAYYYTYYNEIEDMFRIFWTPLYYYLSNMTNTGAAAALPIAKSAVLGLVTLVLGYLSFKFRKNEKAGSGLVFPFAEWIVKAVAAVWIGVFAGLGADSIFNTTHKSMAVASFLVIAVCVFFTCAIAEVVFNFRVRAAVKNAWMIPVFIVVSATILIGYKNDVAGFDRYAPDPESLESVALIPRAANGTESDYMDADGYGVLRDDYLKKNMNLTDKETFVSVAKDGQQLYRSLTQEDENVGQDVWLAVVYYKQKNGKEAWRQIAVPYDVKESDMNALVGTAEYRDAVTGTEGIRKAVANGNIKLTGKADVNLTKGLAYLEGEFTAEELQEFWDAYEKDLEEYDFSLDKNHRPVAQFICNINYKSKDNMENEFPDTMSQTFCLYENYTRSIGFLKKHGIWTDKSYTKESLKNVSEVRVYESTASIDEETGEVVGLNEEDVPEKTFTDKKQIKALLDASEPSELFGSWMEQRADNYTLEFETGPENMSVYAMHPENAPAFVKK